MILNENFVKDGSPILRKRSEELSFPLSDEIKQQAIEMMGYLENSQDPELSEKYGIRPGVGLAAPQIGLDAQLSAVLIPGPVDVDEEGNIIEDQPEPEPFFKGYIVNPKIISESAARASLKTGEGCLSRPDDVEGFVVRAERITVEFYDLDGEKHIVKLVDYPAIVFQHEIDHLHGVMYYDHINKLEPWKAQAGVEYLE